MPIVNRDDAVEVGGRIGRIFSASSSARAGEIRALFVEALDFDPASSDVGLDAAPGNTPLPSSAERVAELDGVHVLYVALDTTETDRVRKGDVAAAARLISEQLGDDLLLVFTNTSASQLHLIQPSFEGARPTLRRVIVERDLPRRTAVQQVSNIYWNHRDSGSIRSALDKTFDVEAVTKAFFAEYKRVFDLAMGRVEGFGGDDEEQESKKLFVQTLFNRLMFIYFLSRKGWLAFQGDKDYLNALWRDYQAGDGDDKNFHVDRLRLLFFAGLNNYRSEDLTSEPESRRLIGEPPFLNGGLFDMADLDSRTNVVVPDECVSEILTKLFDRFNFTVMESTPFDIEVAVDPEMLGKVFEELVTGRHDTGSYYTPRPFVAFMCREALKGYLEGCGAGLAPEDIARFVDERDTSGVGLASAPKVAVVDPACGSGAYLLGMMQELVDLRTALFNVGVDARSLYELKLHIIQRNLYDVDIDEFAVNIAMLRMWLSLVIEYEGDRPEPLPNLDFKVLCGDSLLGSDPSAAVEVQGTLGYDAERVRQLGRLKAEYMRASLGPDKERLRLAIQETEAGVREALGAIGLVQGVVDWRVEFAEVFAQRRGFDIAIANPPYGITVKDRRSAAIGHTDSYTNFMGLAGDLAPNGVMAYITPTSWETGERFKKFRQYLFGKMTLQSVVNLPYDVFETPYVDTAITIGMMGRPPSATFRLATLEKRSELDLTQIADYVISADWSAIAGDASLRVPLLDWAASLFGRVGARATPLGEITSSKRGIAEYKFDILNSPSANALPFFDGQVQRYEVRALSERNFVVISNREMSFHRGLRILTRRLVSRANRLSFARTYDEFVVKEAILPIKPDFDDPQKLAALLAILNSSLMSFLYLNRSTAAVKDDFRQVTLSCLRELPIIFPDATAMAKLAQLVSARERQEGDIEDLEQRIDAIIYETYGVTNAEHEAIATWLARPG